MDTAWIDTQQQLITKDPEKTPLQNIAFWCVYVDKNNELQEIKKQNLNIPDNKHISKEVLLQTIHHHKKHTKHTHSILKDLFLFHIPNDTYEVEKFMENTEIHSFVTSFPVVNDIFIPDSLPIFHSYNTLFAIYVEKPTLKSILKTHPPSSKHITKRVRIKDPKHRFTQKSI